MTTNNRVSLRISKLKAHNLGAVTSHNQRLNSNEKYINVERTQHNKLLHNPYGLDTDKAIQECFKQKGIKPKTNSTVALELVISATPDYFRKDCPHEKGRFEAKPTVAWVKENLKLLKERYGDNLIRVDLHLDESTPHLHAIVVPIVEKEKKRRRTKAQINAGIEAETYTTLTLDADGAFCKRRHFVEAQTAFAKVVEPLGIKRGIRGSRAKHTTLKKFGAMIAEAFSNAVADKPKFSVKKKDLKKKVERNGILGIGRKLESETDYHKRLAELYKRVGEKNLKAAAEASKDNKIAIQLLEKRNQTDRDRASILEEFSLHPDMLESLKDELKTAHSQTKQLELINEGLRATSENDTTLFRDAIKSLEDENSGLTGDVTKLKREVTKLENIINPPRQYSPSYSQEIDNSPSPGF